MLGDQMVPISHFTTTRAVTVDAPPGRSGDIAAPMANPPTPTTSFVIADTQPPEQLVWIKPDCGPDQGPWLSLR